MQKKILIIGGGFAGIRCAQKLSRSLEKNVAHLRLVSDKSYMEYAAAFYQVVTGKNTNEACIPLRTIFEKLPVEWVTDRITKIDLRSGYAIGNSGSTYRYDILVLAVGSETTYFDIPGIAGNAFGMKTLEESVLLKQHIHEILSGYRKEAAKDIQLPVAHIVIIGGGPTGVELAGELGLYARRIAKKHAFPEELITIDIVETMPRLLPMLPANVSQWVERRLRTIGVQIFVNRSVKNEGKNEVFLSDMTVQTKTVIWTAGVRGNALFQKTEGLVTDKKGRVEVTDTLEAKGWNNVYIVGDGAATQFSGMAQTAVRDGAFVAQRIVAGLQGKTSGTYKARKPAFAIPVGPGWAVVSFGPLHIYGVLGWWLRRLADLKVMLLYLPWREACRTWWSGRKNFESCPICET